MSSSDSRVKKTNDTEITRNGATNKVKNNNVESKGENECDVLDGTRYVINYNFENKLGF